VSGVGQEREALALIALDLLDEEERDRQRERAV
jgi:hypothetical protein